MKNLSFALLTLSIFVLHGCDKKAEGPGAHFPDFTKTESGLMYKDTQIGTGPSPKAGDRITVHYTGTLMDGTVFDSSVSRGQPATFPIGIGRLIKCWDEGLMTMKQGGKRTLGCPPEIAYGDAGSPPVIPPKATLKFEVELIQVPQAAPEAAAAAPDAPAPEGEMKK